MLNGSFTFLWCQDRSNDVVRVWHRCELLCELTSAVANFRVGNLTIDMSRQDIWVCTSDVQAHRHSGRCERVSVVELVRRDRKHHLWDAGGSGSEHGSGTTVRHDD